MRLIHLCIDVIVKPDVLKLYELNLLHLPHRIKKQILYILCKRGSIYDVTILESLLCGSLKELDLSECIVTDEILNAVSVCKSLERLDLSLRRRQNRCITSEALASLFVSLPCLQIVAVPHCRQVTDDVIESIANHCSSLQELHIPNTAITDVGLIILGECLTQLRVINLLGTQISDAGINQLVKGPLAETLIEINIDKCLGLTEAASILIDKFCPNIKIFTCGTVGFGEDDSTLNRIQSKVKQIFWSV